MLEILGPPHIVIRPVCSYVQSCIPQKYTQPGCGIVYPGISLFATTPIHQLEGQPIVSYRLLLASFLFFSFILSYSILFYLIVFIFPSLSLSVLYDIFPSPSVFFSLLPSVFDSFSLIYPLSLPSHLSHSIICHMQSSPNLFCLI